MSNEMQSPVEFSLFDSSSLERMTAIRHICFPESNVTKLGYDAQRRFCDWLINGPHDVIPLGAFVNGQLAGFLIAGRFRGVVSGFIKSNKLFMARQFLRKPSLLLDKSIRAQIKHMTLLFTTPSRIPKGNVLEVVSNKSSCGMLDLAVHPDFRSLGLGTQLMTEGEEIALKRGYTHAHCSVLKTNPKVIQFHQRHGYRVVVDKADSVHMVKDLTP